MPWGLSGYALQKTRSMVSELYAAQEQQRRLAQQGTQKQLQEQGGEMTPFELRILKMVGGKVRDTINHMLVEEILPRIGKKAERVLEDRLTVTEDRIRRLEEVVKKLPPEGTE